MISMLRPEAGERPRVMLSWGGPSGERYGQLTNTRTSVFPFCGGSTSRKMATTRP
jgi:hypothetical protein